MPAILGRQTPISGSVPVFPRVGAGAKAITMAFDGQPTLLNGYFRLELQRSKSCNIMVAWG
jgi:hypothetical protein